MTQTDSQKAAAAKAAAEKTAAAKAAAEKAAAAKAAAEKAAATAIAAAFAHTGAAAMSDATASKLATKLTSLDVIQTHEDVSAAAIQAAYQAVTETARISHGQALLIVAQLRAAG